MKTLLTIGSETYLTSESDLAKLLALTKTLTRVKERVLYGPGEKTGTRYDEELGYCRRQVAAQESERIRIEVVRDEEVVTEDEFNRLQAETEKRNLAWLEKHAALPSAA